ncbi:choline transporter-like protein 2 isoform X1 [Hippocampus zosterae]|uniref:choline transporter-like protein 2 isoform X1 n=1 Tax=Hippocampus zosterae TaxID=109293 RepID=UPI00223D1F69|nr:choline transporter-like protein 2 isoform X1 [Hippocampus zosterae]
MEPEEKKSEFKYREVRKFDPEFKGPLQNRGCTDIICCMLFLLALVVYLGVGILAWSQGDPRKILYPTDSRGNFCGQKGTEQEDKHLLFYFNILACANPVVLVELQCPTTQICVKRCPTKHLTLQEAQTNSKDREYYARFCKPGVENVKTTHAKREYCPALILASKVFARRCIPSLSRLDDGTIVVGNESSVQVGDEKVSAGEVYNATRKANMRLEARQLAMKIFEDYTQSWHYIVIALTVATICSWLFIVLLRFLAGIVVWIMIALVIVVIAYGALHCYIRYQSLAGDTSADVTIRELGMQSDITIYLEIRQTWFIFTITLLVVEFLVIVTLIFLRKRILIAVCLIKESSRALGHVKSSLFYPLLTSFLLAVVIAYWAVTAVYLATSNAEVYHVVADDNCTHRYHTCDPKTFATSDVMRECPKAECNFAYYGGDTLYHKYLIVFQFYNVFLFFWCCNFVTALGQVTLAGAFASYYWAFKKPDDMPPNPVLSSLARTLKYHTGSVAFGSLILSVIQIIRVLLEYLDQKLQGARNKYTKFLLKCMKCFFWCLETCIKFLNRNAYIMMAIYGKNFCTSAQDAFMLLLRNIVRVAVLDKVTDFLLLLGKLLIVGVIGIISFFFFTGRTDSPQYSPPNLNYYWVPILTNIIGSYFIAHGFFSVYSMCVDTLFLCFCEDLERNDGTPGRPYYMSPELRDLIGLGKRSEGDGDDANQAGAQEEETVQEDQVELKLESQVSHWYVEDEPQQADYDELTEKNARRYETQAQAYKTENQTQETKGQAVSKKGALEEEQAGTAVVMRPQQQLRSEAPPKVGTNENRQESK